MTGVQTCALPISHTLLDTAKSFFARGGKYLYIDEIHKYPGWSQDIPGSSAVFETGCVTYANCVKERLLGVPHETLVTYGAVSEQTARAMAEGIVRESGADIGVGITGIAGPDGGTEEKPVGLVYIALSDGKNTWVAKRQPMGRLKSREWHRHCAASKALDMVRRYLAGLPVDEA